MEKIKKIVVVGLMCAAVLPSISFAAEGSLRDRFFKHYEMGVIMSDNDHPMGLLSWQEELAARIAIMKENFNKRIEKWKNR